MTNRFAPIRSKFALGVLGASLSLALGCAKVAPSAEGSGGRTGSGSGSSSGTGNNTGTGNRGAGGGGVIPDAGNNDGVCQMAMYNFAPKIPNVLVLVDGSGSMFQTSASLPNGAWGALRTAVLPVIQGLQLTPDGQPQIDFGLGVFTGVAPAMCPIFKTVPIAPSNYDMISAQYPNGPLSNMKLETPVTQVLPMLPPLFTNAPGNGGNYVLFVTDGEPDFCDDGNTVCPVDAVVAEIKQLNGMGITTYVIGLSSNSNASTCPDVLQQYANAGVNQPIANPCGTHNAYNECFGNGMSPWAMLASQLHRTTGQALVDYVPTGGTAQVFKPDVTDQQALTSTLAGLFSGVKSCTFDLNSIDPGKPTIKVNTNALAGARILVETTVVPLDSTNGWKVNCVPAGNPDCKPTQIELTGSACTNWRLPANKNITFDFPCDVIVPG